MNIVEKKYKDKICAMTGTEKVQKSCMLHQEFFDACKFHLLQQNPSISEKDLKVLLAKKFYPNDISLIKLLDSK